MDSHTSDCFLSIQQLLDWHKIVESINVDISTRLFSSPILVITYLFNLFFVNVPCCHKLLGSLLLQNERVYSMFEKFIYKQTCFRIRRAYHRLQLLSDNLMSFSSTIDFITEQKNSEQNLSSQVGSKENGFDLIH